MHTLESGQQRDSHSAMIAGRVPWYMCARLYTRIQVLCTGTRDTQLYSRITCTLLTTRSTEHEQAATRFSCYLTHTHLSRVHLTTTDIARCPDSCTSEITQWSPHGMIRHEGALYAATPWLQTKSGESNRLAWRSCCILAVGFPLHLSVVGRVPPIGKEPRQATATEV